MISDIKIVAIMISAILISTSPESGKHIMAAIVLFANPKGGVGKSTLACSLAAALAVGGVNVRIADLNDSQHTAARWAETRKLNGYEPEIHVDIAQPARVAELSKRCDVLVVDTPCWAVPNTMPMAALATYIVVPTGPNVSLDVVPTLELLHELRRAGVPDWQIGIALSRFNAPATANEERLVRGVLSEAGFTPLSGVIRQMATFSTALAEGLGLSETGRDNLNTEAMTLLAAIHGGLGGAIRRFSRQQTRTEGQTQKKERER
jgi:chromosome partitioning protein